MWQAALHGKEKEGAKGAKKKGIRKLFLPVLSEESRLREQRCSKLYPYANG